MRPVVFSLCLTWLLATFAIAEQPQAVPKITADEIARVFDFNEATAEEYLDHKIVEITGKPERVFSIYAEHGKKTVRQFVVELKASSIPVQCTFDEKYRKALAQIRPNEEVVIRGMCLGRTAYKRPGRQTAPASNAGPAQSKEPQPAAIVFTDCVVMPVAFTTKSADKVKTPSATTEKKP